MVGELGNTYGVGTHPPTVIGTVTPLVEVNEVVSSPPTSEVGIPPAP